MRKAKLRAFYLIKLTLHLLRSFVSLSQFLLSKTIISNSGIQCEKKDGQKLTPLVFNWTKWARWCIIEALAIASHVGAFYFNPPRKSIYQTLGVKFIGSVPFLLYRPNTSYYSNISPDGPQSCSLPISHSSWPFHQRFLSFLTSVPTRN